MFVHSPDAPEAPAASDTGNTPETSRLPAPGADWGELCCRAGDVAAVFRNVVPHHMRLDLLLTGKTADLDIMLTADAGGCSARTATGGAFDDRLQMALLRNGRVRLAAAFPPASGDADDPRGAEGVEAVDGGDADLDGSGLAVGVSGGDARAKGLAACTAP